MILKDCKYPADQEDAAVSCSTTEAEKGLSNLFNLLGGMLRYMIKTPPLWIPLAFLVSATIFFWVTDVDLLLSRQFYVSNGSPFVSKSLWPLRFAEPWKSLNELGVYPALIMGGADYWSF